MKWLLLLCLFAFAPAPPVHAAQRVCRPTRVEHILYWPGEGPDVVGVPLPGQPLGAALLALHGPTFWIKDAEYGHFDIPPDWSIEVKIVVLPGYQSFWFAVTPSRPGDVFVFAFPNDAVYADARGQHYGPHPICGAFTISRAEADRVLALTR
jgi:hypothetical protein